MHVRIIEVYNWKVHMKGLNCIVTKFAAASFFFFFFWNYVSYRQHDISPLNNYVIISLQNDP